MNQSTQYFKPITKNQSNEDMVKSVSSEVPSDSTMYYSTPVIDSPSPNIFIGFNDDNNCFFCGTETGFYVYNTNQFRERFHREFDGGIGIVEIFGKSNIVALVGGGTHPKFSPTNVVLWDDYQNKVLTNLEYSKEVRAVRCRDKKIMVVLHNKVLLYNFSDLHMIAQYETYNNPNGLCAIVSNQSNNNYKTILAIPGGKMGDLRIEFLELKKSFAIAAHQNDLSQICLSIDGTLCATTSNRGTLIRIWNTEDGTLRKELRRGIDQVNILSLAFSSDNSNICLSSDKGTIHIYSLIDRQNAQEHEKNKKSSLSFMKRYIPYLASEWSLTSFSIPGNQASICCFSPNDNNIIMIITKEGKFYQYRYIPGQDMVQLIKTAHYG